MTRPKLRMMDQKVRAIELRRVMPPEKVAAPFYSSPEWRALMAQLIKGRGRRCQNCGRTDCMIFGDHIVELHDGGDPLDPGNVLLRCGSCHTTKTNEVRKERQQRVHE